MNARSIVVAITTGLLGFIIGILNGPVDFRTAGTIRGENARLRKQVEVYKKLVETNKAEHREAKAVLAESK